MHHARAEPAREPNHPAEKSESARSALLYFSFFSPETNIHAGRVFQHPAKSLQQQQHKAQAEGDVKGKRVDDDLL